MAVILFKFHRLSNLLLPHSSQLKSSNRKIYSGNSFLFYEPLTSVKAWSKQTINLIWFSWKDLILTFFGKLLNRRWVCGISGIFCQKSLGSVTRIFMGDENLWT